MIRYSLFSLCIFSFHVILSSYIQLHLFGNILHTVNPLAHKEKHPLYFQIPLRGHASSQKYLFFLNFI